MSPEDFVQKVIDLYKDARMVQTFNYSVSSVVRGHSKCISSETEDLLATYIATHIHGINIYVNQPISYHLQNGKKVNIQPDIVITKIAEDGNEEIIYLADLKNDLGYQRHLIDNQSLSVPRDATYLKYVDIVGQLKTHNVTIQDKQTKTRPVSVLKELRYDLIIITGANSGKRPSVFQQRIADINKQNIPLKVWVLTTGCHPNDYGKGTRPLTAPSIDLTKLIIDLTKLINNIP